MTVSQALASAAALTGQVIPTAEAVRWLSELDGRLSLVLFGAAHIYMYTRSADTAFYTWFCFHHDTGYAERVERVNKVLPFL